MRVSAYKAAFMVWLRMSQSVSFLEGEVGGIPDKYCFCKQLKGTFCRGGYWYGVCNGYT